MLQSVDDQLVAVNQELVILLSAADNDGDEVFYSYSSNVPDIHSRAALRRLPVGVGEFRWTPRASDIGVWYFDFSATDGSQTDTITIRVEVRAALGGNSTPRFLHPQGSGTTLDLEKEACIDLNVEVIDADSAEVDIYEADPTIEGAELELEGGLRGRWRWCPSAAQIDADDRYTLLLAADDGENPRTLHPYLLVLRRATKPDCPGQAPVVDHQPQDQNTLGNVEVLVDISDDLGLKKEPLLYYSETMPSSPPDLAQMIQLTMSLESGTMADGRWRGEIPNPVVSAGSGASATLYYFIVADDDDDAMGDCDHVTRAPDGAPYQLVVTNPGGSGGVALCEPCTADLQCGGAQDLCVRVGSGSESFCLQECSAGCPTDYECSSGSVESVEGVLAAQCVPVSLDCSDPGGMVCQDDALENNDSAAEAMLMSPLGAGSIDLISCPASSGVGDDEDWFRVDLAAESQLQASLLGTAASDLDLAVYDSSQVLLDSSTSLSSSEAVNLCLPAGSYLLRVFAFGNGENAYTLNTAIAPMSCVSSTCTDDAAEEDDNRFQAQAVDLGTPFSAQGRQICVADQDWFAIEMNNGESVGVSLSFSNSDGDLDLHFHDEQGTDLTPCSPADVTTCDTGNGQSGTDDESAVFSAPSSGCSPCTRYVVVTGFDGDEASYDIEIEKLP